MSVCNNIYLSIIFLLFFSTAILFSLSITIIWSGQHIKDSGVQRTHSLILKGKSQIESFLSQPTGQLRGLQAASVNSPLPNVTELSNPDWYHEYFRHLLSDSVTMRSSYQSAMIGFDDGNAIDCRLDPTPGDVAHCCAFLWRGRAASGGNSSIVDESYNTTTYERITTATNRTTTYDPRTQGWYRLVDRKSFAMEWSRVHLSVQQGHPTAWPVINVTGAMMNATGHLIGVASYSLGLKRIQDILQQMQVTKHAYTALIDSDDMVIAATYPTPHLLEKKIPEAYNGTILKGCVMVSNRTNQQASKRSSSLLFCLKSVADYGWIDLREFNEKKQRFQSISSMVGMTLLQSGTTFIAVEKIEGQNWRLIVMIPEDNIIPDVYRHRDYFALATLGAFILSIIVSLGQGSCTGKIAKRRKALQNAHDLTRGGIEFTSLSPGGGGARAQRDHHAAQNAGSATSVKPTQHALVNLTIQQ